MLVKDLTFKKKQLSAGVIFAAALAMIAPIASADSLLTKEQGDEIIQELRDLKDLLKQQIAAGQRPANSAAVVLKYDVTDAPWMGAADAPVSIVAFVDYQCPYCRKYQSEVYPQLKKLYIDTGKIKYFVSNLPLQALHPNAMLAAESALCARSEGVFWKLHDSMLAKDAALDVDSIQAYANNIGLRDQQQFLECVRSHKFAEVANHDLDRIKNLGLSGTPSFIVGKLMSGMVVGTSIVGSQPFEIFERRIADVSGSHNVDTAGGR